MCKQVSTLVNSYLFSAVGGSSTIFSSFCHHTSSMLFFLKEIKCIIREESRRDHSQADAFILVTMSHGENGYVFGSDDKVVNIEDDIAGVLGGCRSLKNKPKILIFQACRGLKTFQFQFILHISCFYTLFGTGFYFEKKLKYILYPKN